MIERQTYDALQWLGDVGGLFDMLGLLGGSLIGPIAAFKLKAELLTRAFRFTPSLANAEKEANKLHSREPDDDPLSQSSKLVGEERAKAHMKWDFANSNIIKKHGFIMTMLGFNQ